MPAGIKDWIAQLKSDRRVLDVGSGSGMDRPGGLSY
jgi:hypothetical protein